MGRKSELSVAQRQDVVLRMLRKEEPVTVLARRFGVSETTLQRWREEFLKGGREALSAARGKSGADRKDAQIKEMERDVAERDRVIGELTIANRILKKVRDGSL